MTSDSAIDISNLQFTWPGQEKPLLDIESFRVAKGEKVFLCGPSGSGKSTLLNLVGGVLAANRGQLAVLDKDLARMSSSARDQFRGHHMGFIFQMFNLIPYLSMVENVILPCRFSKSKAQRILEGGGSLESEAERLLSHLNINVEEMKNRPVTELSVGQQQRVATARALMGQPEIIIADEPTSALDADTRDSFIELLFAECSRSQATLLFVSHDSVLGQKFDRTDYLSTLNKVGGDS